MNRLGLSIELLESTPSLFNTLVKPSTIITHFSESEIEHSKTSNKQIDNFKEAMEVLYKKHGLDKNKTKISLNNSAASTKALGSDFLEKTINRCGIAIYGASPNETPLDDALLPSLSLWAPIIDIHKIKADETVGYNGMWRATEDSIIATIGIGYGDGYPRHAENGTPVLINNQYAKLAGRVSMDMISVDITHLDQDQIKVGSLACLWGPQNNVETIAKHAQTISYELLTGIRSRVAKIYHE